MSDAVPASKRGLRDRLGPYVPALATIGVVIGLGLAFRSEVGNWFRGRPLTVGEASRVVTVEAGSARLGVAVRPATPLAGENELFVGVGDRQGVLAGDATLEVQVGDGAWVAAEGRRDGQFRAVVEVPERGPIEVRLRPGSKAGAADATALIVLEAGRQGVARPGQADGVAYHTCPMHPSIRASSPGTCPICGMDLVPVTHDEITTGAVRIDARRRQLIGVKTAVLDVRPMRRSVRMTGIATWDETRLVDVTARADGWVEELFADYTGKPLKAGDPIARLYVPEIRSAQLELLAAAKGHGAATGTMLEASASDLHKAAREKLRALGVSDEDLRRLGRGGEPIPTLTLRAPVDGVVAEKMVKRGSPVMANQPMLRIGGLDPIWVEAHVYEQDAALIRVGLDVAVSFPYVAGEPRHGAITFIEPVIDAETRTVRVRVELGNADGALRPGMYANLIAVIDLSPRLVVPHEAVIFAGPRKLVFVDEGGGLMRPVEVELGVRDDEGFEVKKGLAVGMRVVTSGNFLIGAESRLRSALGAW